MNYFLFLKKFSANVQSSSMLFRQFIFYCHDITNVYKYRFYMYKLNIYIIFYINI